MEMAMKVTLVCAKKVNGNDNNFNEKENNFDIINNKLEKNLNKKSENENNNNLNKNCNENDNNDEEDTTETEEDDDDDDDDDDEEKRKEDDEKSSGNDIEKSENEEEEKEEEKVVIVNDEKVVVEKKEENNNNIFKKKKLIDLPAIIINKGSFEEYNEDDFELESETTTLSSTPTSSVPEHELQFDEALIQEKFNKLGLSQYLDDVDIDENSNENNDENDESQDNNNNNEKARIPLLRSISLKTGKTPPNTPSQKKFVRFADSLGLELAFVKNIYQDDLPNVPRSAFHDLKLPDENFQQQRFTFTTAVDSKFQTKFAIGQQQAATLMPEFVQPCVLSNFLGRIRQQKVCLENCLISAGSMTLNITCIIRVLNISFEKDVLIRYTFDEWRKWTDVSAKYLPGSSDGWSDKFSANFDVPVLLGGPVMPGQRILFAIRYVTNFEEFWDNNMGLNYSLIYRV